MDDICDSVPTVESAQQLTKDLDEILDNGGFKLKDGGQMKPWPRICKMNIVQVLSFWKANQAKKY